MKKEISMLIIGVLIGAIITTGVFLILKGNDKNKTGKPNGERPTASMDGNAIEERGKMKGKQNGENKTEQKTTESSNENS